MSKKRPDITKLGNELRESAFFTGRASDQPLTSTPTAQPSVTPVTTPTPPSVADPADAVSEVEERTPVRPVRDVPPVRPARRQMIRHPFEVYQDQLERLRELAAEERLTGGAGSMSAMVRQAIDHVINERSTEST